MNIQSKWVGVPCYLLFFCSTLFSQYTFFDCPDLQASDFQYTQLFKKQATESGITLDSTLNEPVQIDMDARMNGPVVEAVDIYFAERKGSVKRFDGVLKTIVEIGKLDVRTDSDQGINGIALDPNFKTNKWIYLYYSVNTGTAPRRRFRLSRFTLNGINTMNMATEKVLIEIEGGFRDDWHHGGPMAFDKNGDLWITVGNDSPDHNNGGTGSQVSNDSILSDQWGAGNTASLRGSILRIHPDNSPKGYSIPEDNFGEYWAKEFEVQGRTSLSHEYRDTLKVLPEVYTKGHRSNYSITAHPTKNWIAFGEVNPASADDEFTIVKNPIFAGYPYFYGNQKLTSGHSLAPESPVNNSTIHSGVTDLPPAVPGTINGLARVGITGPIYVYDSTLQSDIKFPPHFSNHWFNFDFTTQKMWTMALDENGDVYRTEEISGVGKLMDSLILINPLDAHFGPDGALYILNYAGYFYSTDNTGVTRVEYRGNCRPTTVSAKREQGSNKKIADINFAGIKVYSEGSHVIRVFDFVGKELGAIHSESKKEYRIEDICQKKPSGLFWIRVESKDGVVTKKMLDLP